MDLQNYLKLNIDSQKEIENTTSFYDKFNSLSILYQQQNSHEKILRSQGKYNSKIILIFRDEEHFKDSKKSLERVFTVYGIKFWDVLILFKDKFVEYDRNINVLLQEILIVNPMVVYIFDDNTLEEDLRNRCPSGTILGFMIINVNNIKNLIEQNVSSEIFKLFEYLITYNY